MAKGNKFLVKLLQSLHVNQLTMLFFVSQASTRLIANLFSLPIPPGYSHGFKGHVTGDSGRFVPDYLGQKSIQKFLLIGLEGSGSSTIFKQVYNEACLYLNPSSFSHIVVLMLQTRAEYFSCQNLFKTAN